MPEQMRVEITPNQRVTAIVYPAVKPDQACATLLPEHGAGAGQTSGFMMRFATELAARGINVVTINFLYTEAGPARSRRKQQP
jgi:predicted alpha/beta-hydrolase family hydrolase